MTRVEAEAIIAAPVERVFDAITDPKQGSRWNPNILAVTDLSSFPVQKGTTWRQTTVMLGRPTELDCQIVGFEPPHQGVLHVSGPQQATIVTSCLPTERGTRVTQVVEFHLPGGPLGGMAAKFIGPRMQRELDETLNRLKEIVERECEGVHGSGTEK
jgi:uncharacterized protein YndB with AHSA1/START domain